MTVTTWMTVTAWMTVSTFGSVPSTTCPILFWSSTAARIGTCARRAATAANWTDRRACPRRCNAAQPATGPKVESLHPVCKPLHCMRGCICNFQAQPTWTTGIPTCMFWAPVLGRQPQGLHPRFQERSQAQNVHQHTRIAQAFPQFTQLCKRACASAFQGVAHPDQQRHVKCLEFCQESLRHTGEVHNLAGPARGPASQEPHAQECCDTPVHVAALAQAERILVSVWTNNR
jgi:hypothetical protein